MAITVLPCPCCDGTGRVATFLDPYHRLSPCPECDGSSEAHCHVRGCNDLASDAAVDARGGCFPMCARHFAEWRADVEAET